MPTAKNDIAVAVYDIQAAAASAVKELQQSGFNMKRISILGRDYETQEYVVGFLHAGDRARIFGQIGAFWSALMGVLSGSARVFIPVVGQVIVLGPLAAAIFGGPPGSVTAGAVSALPGALTAIGIPGDFVLRYETAVKANRVMLVVHGDERDIDHARELLETSGMLSFKHHHVHETEPVRVDA